MTYPWKATAFLVLAACAHELPPEPRVVQLDTFPSAGPPIRLTNNPGRDAAPAFSADGLGLWYSWEKIDRSDLDICLGLLSLAGGTRLREECHTAGTANPDSVNWYLWAAPHADGHRVAWFRLSAKRGSPLSFPYSGEVVIADLGQRRGPPKIDSVQAFPIQVAPGHVHQQPQELQWLDDTTLVYLDVLIAVEFGQSLPQDTLYSGVEVGILTLGSGGVRKGFIPGTDGASGVAVGPGGQVYFTLKGDNRIFRTGAAGGVIDTVYDLGPGTTIARDPAIHDTVAYVIVDGDVQYRPLGLLGLIQGDAGGALWRVTPGTRTLLDSTLRWQHPAISADGATLLLEGRSPGTGKTDLYMMRLTP